MTKFLKWLSDNLRVNVVRELNYLVMQETMSLRDGLQGTYVHEVLVLQIAVCRLKYEILSALARRPS